jgi:hypothetical protein
MERRRFGQSAVRREEQLQELYDMWALPVAMHLLWPYTKRQENVNT